MEQTELLSRRDTDPSAAGTRLSHLASILLINLYFMATICKVSIGTTEYGNGLFTQEDMKEMEVALAVHRSEFVVYD